MKELYGIDMEAEGQYSKLIDEIPAPDTAISMGCNEAVRLLADHLMITGDWTTLPEKVMRNSEELLKKSERISLL